MELQLEEALRRITELERRLDEIIPQLQVLVTFRDLFAQGIASVEDVKGWPRERSALAIRQKRAGSL